MEAYVRATHTRKENAKKAKPLTAMIQTVTPEVMDYMQKSKQTYLPTGAGEYVVLNTKSKPPPMKRDFIATSFVKFLQMRNVACQPNDGLEFIKFMDIILQQNSTDVTTVNITDQKPVGAFFAQKS